MVHPPYWTYHSICPHATRCDAMLRLASAAGATGRGIRIRAAQASNCTPTRVCQAQNKTCLLNPSYTRDSTFDRDDPADLGLHRGALKSKRIIPLTLKCMHSPLSQQSLFLSQHHQSTCMRARLRTHTHTHTHISLCSKPHTSFLVHLQSSLSLFRRRSVPSGSHFCFVPSPPSPSRTPHV